MVQSGSPPPRGQGILPTQIETPSLCRTLWPSWPCLTEVLGSLSPSICFKFGTHTCVLGFPALDLEAIPAGKSKALCFGPKKGEYETAYFIFGGKIINQSSGAIPLFIVTETEHI